MKVLIVSHNCFSSTQSMGKTLASLFSSFKKSELMQLYFYPSLPNINVCDNYYRITDKDILKSILRRSQCGRTIENCEINEANTLFESVDVAQSYNSLKRNSSFIRRMRDIAWQLGNWKTNNLKNWLLKEKPDVVFYALGDATFSMKIARWVSNFLEIPLVSYICDEYYFSLKNTKNVFLKFISTPLKINIKKTIKKSMYMITICEPLGILYKTAFGIDYITIMTGSTIETEKLSNINEEKQISYIGNTSLNRWQSLIELSEAVNTLNTKYDCEFEFVYYGNESCELSEVNTIKYGGYLTAEQVKQTMVKSCLLIHVETFDSEYRERLRYSVSTKIADSLSSGVPIFAYGPDDIASIQHLQENNCAIICSEQDKLEYLLEEALMNDSLRQRISATQLEVAKKYHNAEKNSNYLKLLIDGIVLNGGTVNRY